MKAVWQQLRPGFSALIVFLAVKYAARFVLPWIMDHVPVRWPIFALYLLIIATIVLAASIGTRLALQTATRSDKDADLRPVLTFLLCWEAAFEGLRIVRLVLDEATAAHPIEWSFTVGDGVALLAMWLVGQRFLRGMRRQERAVAA